MAVIPPGSYLLGAPESESGASSDEKPQHRVRIAQPFAIGRYAVTFEDYDRFCVETCRQQPVDRGWGRGRRPVIDVSWEDAVAYGDWLSAQTGQTYRLPTEAEWEYAARAGTATAYWWGDEIGRGNANCDGCGSQWDDKETAPVGSFKPNAFGLFDTAGNVWEWVADCFHDNYKGAPADGSTWDASGSCPARVLRGGCWNSYSRNLRSANRLRYGTGDRGYDIGFRVARTLTP
jgi:formylglycine-generating enzyme required for sulfatase activity